LRCSKAGACRALEIRCRRISSDTAALQQFKPDDLAAHLAAHLAGHLAAVIAAVIAAIA
jgi:hypothetical protein